MCCIRFMGKMKRSKVACVAWMVYLLARGYVNRVKPMVGA